MATEGLAAKGTLRPRHLPTMRSIGPHECEYLGFPYMSTGEDMLYYAIQHLCFTEAVDLHYWKALAHPKNPHVVIRLFLTRKSVARPLTAAEAFVLDLLPEGRSIHLGELRAIMKEQVKDMDAFKFDRVRKDLKAAGLLRFTYWPTSAGHAARRQVKQRLSALERDVETLMARPAELDAHLTELGSNVAMLDDDTRETLKKVKGRTPDLAAVFAIGSFLATDGVYMDPGSLTGFSYGGGGGFSGGGGGGFGGFGGGGFGGGGAGGSW